jgi:hypothetical protein
MSNDWIERITQRTILYTTVLYSTRVARGRSIVTKGVGSYTCLAGHLLRVLHSNTTGSGFTIALIVCVYVKLPLSLHGGEW